MKKLFKLKYVMMAASLLLLVLAGEANAGWWGGWGGSCGSWGGGYRTYGSCGSYGGYGGYYGGYGGSYYGGYGRGYYGGYGRGYGRGYGGGWYTRRTIRRYPVHRGAVVTSSRPVTVAPQSQTTPTSTRTAQRTKLPGRLAVTVPENATVYVNGKRTRSTGSQRLYRSRELSPRESIKFTVRAVVEQNGRDVEETRVVSLQPGKTAQLAFDLATEKSVETALILHVPAEAQVHIAGKTSPRRGPKRVFTTNRLAVGKQVNDFNVRVTLQRNGTTLAKEQTITLRGGRSHELTFDFDDTVLASRN